MAERPELTSRKATVLHTIVEAYVATGEPVGSEAIADRAKLGVSSATIRNEMAALEELGYLSHPHTSAGRIPTDIGYRHYVDTLPVGGKLREGQRREIAAHFAEAIVDLEEVLKGSVQLLSRLTQYAGLAVPPGASEEQIIRMELIDMGPSLMVLVVGQHGRVDKQVLDSPEHLEPSSVREAERRLQSIRGQTYAEAQATLLQLAAEAHGDGQRTGLELPKLRPAVGKHAVDRRHAPAQLVRGTQLIDRRAQNRADRVADPHAGKQQHG